jgi:hypothetical protein
MAVSLWKQGSFISSFFWYDIFDTNFSINTLYQKSLSSGMGWNLATGVPD